MEEMKIQNRVAQIKRTRVIMRKFRFLKMILAAVLLTVTVSVYGQDKVIPYEEVPKEIQIYVKNHFPDHKVLQAEVDFEGLQKEYDIILEDNIKLEFNRQNKIESIEARTELPASVIPAKISTYVKANYPENYIVEWEIDRTHQSVDLDNKLELEFTLKGDFLRIDG